MRCGYSSLDFSWEHAVFEHKTPAAANSFEPSRQQPSSWTLVFLSMSLSVDIKFFKEKSFLFFAQMQTRRKCCRKKQLHSFQPRCIHIHVGVRFLLDGLCAARQLTAIRYETQRKKRNQCQTPTMTTTHSLPPATLEQTHRTRRYTYFWMWAFYIFSSSYKRPISGWE